MKPNRPANQGLRHPRIAISTRSPAKKITPGSRRVAMSHNQSAATAATPRVMRPSGHSAPSTVVTAVGTSSST